jgi:hypothetical protein
MRGIPVGILGFVQRQDLAEVRAGARVHEIDGRESSAGNAHLDAGKRWVPPGQLEADSADGESAVVAARGAQRFGAKSTPELF